MERPAGKKACGNCSEFKKIKFIRAVSTSKQNFDDLTTEGQICSEKMSSATSSVLRKRRKPSNSQILKDRKMIDFNHNPAGINRYSKKAKITPTNSADSPSTKISIGKHNSKSKRLAKKIKFKTSPSKMASKGKFSC
jgi:hypothetical protein